VLHACDNPRCCNPAHLRAGSHADNTNDMMQKRRHRTRAFHGESHPMAKLGAADVLTIRARHARGESNAALAIEYGMSKSAIKRAVSGTTWAKLT